ncbi:MAG TPA: trehalose-phosphatase [Thermoanaerobaculia bacterium]|nr:trehalose-phosphatase [Thermoanaerobaculia bacterium]
MRVLTPGLSVKRFFERLAGAPRRALLLDLDGTLAPFSADRTRARPHPAAREELLLLLAARASRVAIVSGRGAREVRSLLDLAPAPEIWGSHGLERLEPDGAYRVAALSASARARIDEAATWAQAQGFSALLERKPVGLALHARGAGPGEFDRAREAAVALWNAPLREAGLEPLEFDGGIEWRPAGGHKGQVVATVLAQEGPGAAVAYLGDDRTDEDAFAALQGLGLAVLVRSSPRPTAANLWIEPPEGLVEFLARWRLAQTSRH